MEIRFFKLALGITFAVSLASLGVIFLFINANQANVFSLILFSIAALMFLFSLFSWTGLWLRKNYLTERNLNKILKMVFREGGLAAFLGIAYLWLSHYSVFKIWTALPILVLIAGIEYYFLIRE